VCLHYLINRLQPLPWQQPVVVSLNPPGAIRPGHGDRRVRLRHPVFDLAAIAAQQRCRRSRAAHVWFAAPGRATASMRTA
jgi:predicted NAD/FAD-binding protein